MKKTMLVLAVCIIATQLIAQNSKSIPVPPPPPPPVELTEIPPPPPPPVPPPPEALKFVATAIEKEKPTAPPMPPRPPKPPMAPKGKVKVTHPAIEKDAA